MKRVLLPLGLALPILGFCLGWSVRAAAGYVVQAQAQAPAAEQPPTSWERSRTEQVGGYEVTTLYHPPTRSCFLVVRSMASYDVSVTETLPQVCSQEYRR